MTANSENKWVGWFRFITPILVTIALWLLVAMDHKIDGIDDKLFKHLTNDEMHSPRSLTVGRAEFGLYQEMRQRQLVDIKDSLNIRIDGMRQTLEKLIMVLENHNMETRRGK